MAVFRAAQPRHFSSPALRNDPAPWFALLFSARREILLVAE